MFCWVSPFLSMLMWKRRLYSSWLVTINLVLQINSILTTLRNRLGLGLITNQDLLVEQFELKFLNRGHNKISLPVHKPFKGDKKLKMLLKHFRWDRSNRLLVHVWLSLSRVWWNANPSILLLLPFFSQLIRQKAEVQLANEETALCGSNWIQPCYTAI